MPRLSRYLSGVVLAIVLGAATGISQPLQGVGQTRVRLSDGPRGEPRVQIDAGDVTDIPRGTAAAPVRRDGIAVSSTLDSPETLVITTAEEPVLLETLGIGQWNLDLPAHSTVKVKPDFNNRSVQLSASAVDTLPLRLHFFDQASADMAAGSTARVEFLSDGSYSMRASTNVTGTTADGLRVNFSDLNPLILGGELKEVAGPGGTTRFVRSSPSVAVEFVGSPDQEVSVRANGDMITLIRNQDRQITFPNGSAVLLRQDAARQAITWRVIKGVCNFQVEGFTCWKGVATSGQAGSMQWNPARKIIDFSNRSSEALITQLSGRVTASIAPGATFQYAQLQDCGSFVTSAAGGEVILLNRDTGDVARVQEENVVFSEGQRVGAERAERRWTAVNLKWESDARVQLEGAAISLSIEPGNTQTYRSASQELTATYDTAGTLTLRAAKGDFAINPVFIPEFSLELPEAGALVMHISRASSMFTASAAEDSGASIRAVAGGKTYMFLSGTARITVNLGQNAFIPESNAAWIFFEGAGGESIFTSSIHPGPLVVPDRLDVSRIIQEPVSVIE